MNNKKVELSPTLFWSMYNALREAEGVLWECDGATNSENETLVDAITDATHNVSHVLDKLQPTIKSLKSDNENL
jgi:hypothetical protein